MKIGKLIYSLCLSAILLFVGSCGENDKQVLNRDEMISVLHDIQLSEALFQMDYNNYNTKQKKDAVIDDVLQKHRITQAQLDSSLVWYSENVDLYNKVNDSIIGTLKKETNNLRENRPENPDKISTKDIPAYVFFSSKKPTFSFSLDSLATKNYPNFKLKFKALGFSSDFPADFYVQYNYADTLVIDTQKVNNNSSYQSVNPLSEHKLTSVSGYVYIKPGSFIYDIKPLIYNITIDK